MRHGGKGVHMAYCSYKCDAYYNYAPSECKVNYMRFQGLTDMWTSILCPPMKDSTFHDLKCLQGECPDCGIDMLITCPNGEDNASHKLMKCECSEKVVHGKTRVGIDNKVLRVQYKEFIMKIFLSYTKPRLQKIILHYFLAKFQEE